MMDEYFGTIRYFVFHSTWRGVLYHSNCWNSAAVVWMLAMRRS